MRCAMIGTTTPAALTATRTLVLPKQQGTPLPRYLALVQPVDRASAFALPVKSRRVLPPLSSGERRARLCIWMT